MAASSRPGAHAPLDELRSLRDESRRVIAGLEGKYRTQSGVGQLKIKHNGVLGYFIEVGQQHADKLMADKRDLPPSPDHGGRGALFHRRAGDAGVAHQPKPRESALALEAGAVRRDVAAGAGAWRGAERPSPTRWRALDVAAALGELAIAARYVRPAHRRRPGVQHRSAAAIRWWKPRLQAANAGPFVPNDCDLSPDAKGRLWLVTGPNMAGKSTFLRQNALIAILAQMGSFVPAEAAHIGIVDRLFSRVGAGDDLAAAARPSWSRWWRPPRS